MNRLSTLMIGALVTGQAVGQDVFIDKGACLGEGCVYGERWVAQEAIGLLITPDSASPIAATVARGATVQTLTGEVHTVPGRFVVYRSHRDFSPGDSVVLYTYLGEGRFRIQHNGELKVADLDTNPRRRAPERLCELDSNCWGSVQQEPQSDWWIKVETDDGVEGWILDTIDFEKPGYH